jgi:hypothetical protein
MNRIRSGIYFILPVWILILTIGRTRVFAQDQPFTNRARNAIYLELLGANQLYSLNYDRLIGTSSNQHWLFGYRVGGSLVGKHLVKSRVIGELYTLLGPQKSHLELGLSSSLGRNVNDIAPYGGSVNVLVSPVIAYRLQEPAGPSCFRVSLSPYLAFNKQPGGNTTGLLIGVSFGRSF